MPKTTDILYLSDIHTGGQTCPWANNFIYTRNGIHQPLPQNPYAKALQIKWDEMCSRSYDSVVIMGDTIDGSNPKSTGLGEYTTDIKAQADNVTELLQQIRCPRNNWYIFRGSNYHVGDNLSAEEYIGEKLGIPKDHVMKEGIIEFQSEKHTWSIEHSHEITVSRSTWQYRATPIAREMLLAQMNLDELGPIDGIVRGHVHHYVLVKYGHTFGFSCPCWKIRDEYLAKVGLSTIPRLGWVVLELDGTKNRAYIEPHMFHSKEPIIRRFRCGGGNCAEKESRKGSTV